jgi:hypothetical protein
MGARIGRWPSDLSRISEVSDLIIESFCNKVLAGAVT